MRYPTEWCLALATLSHLLPTTSAWPSKPRYPPACIIGAGPAGLSAAGRLQEKGIDAVVFEKQPEIGGKCQSYYDEEGIFHPLGAAFFSNATYPETLEVIEKSGVFIEEFFLAGAREQFRFNITTGETEPFPTPAADFLQLVQAEIPRYIQLWNQVFAPISTTGYKKGVPDNLTVSGTEWFRANNFRALPILLVNPLALYGYGDIRQVPALYVLQYFTPDILTGFVGQHQVYYTDFHKVWVEWAKKKACNVPIKTSHEVRCIDRSGKHPVIKYTYPHGNFFKWDYQECSALIFAFPPTIKNLERAGLDITEQENEVFKDVVINNYFSAAIELALPYGVSYIADSPEPGAPPPDIGEPVAVLRLNAESNVSTAWSWGPDGEFKSEASALEQLNVTMSKLNKDPRNATALGEPLAPSDIRAFRKWDYFPHFNSEPLKDGAYAKLNKLQGCNRSYWASGLQGMEIVEWAIRAGLDVVDSYFAVAPGGPNTPTATSISAVPDVTASPTTASPTPPSPTAPAEQPGSGVATLSSPWTPYILLAPLIVFAGSLV